jgi:hypothetical protein
MSAEDSLQTHWQVIKAGEGLKFIPPDRVIARRIRASGLRWAA